MLACCTYYYTRVTCNRKNDSKTTSRVHLLVPFQALCVEMKNIQSKVNVINRHGQYFTRKARSGLREILEERLRALNEQWDKLQDQASARQKDLEQLVQERTDNELLTGEDSSLNALRSNTALLSSLYFNTENEDIKRLLNRLGLFSADDEECEKMQHLEDDYLDYQASFHDLFEWLTATEEVIANIPTTHCQLSQLRDRLKDLQVLYLAVVTKPFASLSEHCRYPFGTPWHPYWNLSVPSRNTFAPLSDP